MAEEMFGEMTFSSAEKWTKTDLAPYREYLQKLQAQGADQVGEFSTVTGEIVTKDGNTKGRGKQELSDERAFRRAASEMGVGLRYASRHVANGMTAVRMMIQPKREFSAETAAKRDAALDRRRLMNAQAKLAANPDDADAKAKVQELTAKLNPAPKGKTQAK